MQYYIKFKRIIMKIKTNRKAKKCVCIAEINKQMNGLKIDTLFDINGKTYPAIWATNEVTRKKGEKKVRKYILPSFCPWCGKTGFAFGG